MNLNYQKKTKNPADELTNLTLKRLELEKENKKNIYSDFDYFM